MKLRYNYDSLVRSKALHYFVRNNAIICGQKFVLESRLLEMVEPTTVVPLRRVSYPGKGRRGQLFKFLFPN